MKERKKSIEHDRIERHIKLDVDREEDYGAFEKLGKALSSEVRIRMLAILNHKSMNVLELAQALNVPVSSAAFHVNLLEEANLITAEMLPGVRGSQKICSSRAEDVLLSFYTAPPETKRRSFSVDMPIGNYYDFQIYPTCGMVNDETYIESCDDAKSFYSPSRSSAQLMWFHRGFVEYRFPNHFISGKNPSYVSFSLELCSEASGYRNVWPSDITFSINGRELLTYTSPGDFGGRHGKLTPIWWTDGNTQFGLLKTVSVDGSGTYLDGVRKSEEITIDSLELQTRQYISLKIEVKKDAKYVGGINIFGKTYGDYPQNIIMYVEY